MTAMRYRPDIDGLRTIAVVPVVLFHAGLLGFSGGYVGVDIFFVISGYLITGILLADIRQGRYRIGQFYDRRIRRIFPALAAVLLATLAVGWVVLMPADFERLGKGAIAVTVFVSNFHFWKSVDYFDNAHAVEPLLHTWSLAVEEQYYIFFPLLLVWLARRGPKTILPVLIGLTAISFALAAVLVFSKPVGTFYLPITRAWELLVGSILAVQPIATKAGPRVRATAALIGLLLAVAPIALYDERTVFPGLAALPPVLGAALVVWAGLDGRMHGVARLLGTAPMTFVGRISYSLYLWHVPVFAYAVYLTGGRLEPNVAVGATLFSFLLAWVSYRWIETPFRSKGAGSVSRPVLVSLAAMTGILTLSIGIVTMHGMPSRLNPRSAVIAGAADDKQRFPFQCLTVGNTIVSPAKACRLGSPDAVPSALLWGDSHAIVTAGAMDAAARRRHAAFLVAAAADCPVGIGFEIDTGTEKGLTETPSYRFCGEYNREMLRLALETPSLRHVVLSSRWTNWRIGQPANPAEKAVDIRLRDAGGVASGGEENAVKFERGFRRLVHELRAAGKKVTIVGPLPEPRLNIPQRLFIQQFDMIGEVEPISRAQYAQRHQRILAIFDRLERDERVSFVWPITALCQRDVCPLEDEGHPMFFDHNHLSFHAAQRTADLYASVFDNGGLSAVSGHGRE